MVVSACYNQLISSNLGEKYIAIRTASTTMPTGACFLGLTLTRARTCTQRCLDRLIGHSSCSIERLVTAGRHLCHSIACTEFDQKAEFFYTPEFMSGS